MDTFLGQYFAIAIFMGIVLAFALLLLIVSYVVARQVGGKSKELPYECGFDSFEDTRTRFEIKYYLVAILFIIFDLEIAFLFPWAVSLTDWRDSNFLYSDFAFYSVMSFLFVLTMGFVYEWRKGALEWE